MTGIRHSMGAITAEVGSILEGYESPGAWDEAITPDGEPRRHYDAVFDALADRDLTSLAEAVRGELVAAGCEFGGGDAGPSPFIVDPVPRIIDGEEWDALSAGLAQRTTALNHFIADVYGERRIVADGIVPERVLDSADHLEPKLAGIEPRGGVWATVAGLDLVRGADGVMRVLEDNLRTPSGLAYALGARHAVDRRAGIAAGGRREVAGPALAALQQALLAAAPEGVDEPEVVLLSDGPGNSAWWEHRTLAGRLGIPIVVLSDLEHRRGGLVRRDDEGELRRVDVVYRRTDEDRFTGDDGEPTEVARALHEPWRDRRIGVCNAFGTGVADDKLVHAYVEDMVRFYLGEEPSLRSVPTFDLGDEERCEEALARIGELVVKPRSAYGGVGVVIGPLADDELLGRTAAAVRLAPEQFVAQETVMLSTHPTVIDGALRPRHVDLRPFAYSGEGVAIPPGGLSRVAFGEGALIVNSSQNGGAKDTWVMR
jgi:uncharacterized circularly permuted ATP-grasp superfamily protein